jgi:hypothetical protein
LKLELEKVPFAMPRIKAVADGALQIGGSLAALDIGGELAIARGSINVQPGRLASEANLAAPVASAAELLESRWNFDQPLVLLVPMWRATPVRPCVPPCLMPVLWVLTT